MGATEICRVGARMVFAKVAVHEAINGSHALCVLDYGRGVDGHQSVAALGLGIDPFQHLLDGVEALRPGERQRLSVPVNDGEATRFPLPSKIDAQKAHADY
jgi:hypothetical protein